jgi:hypothetical protein
MRAVLPRARHAALHGGARRVDTRSRAGLRFLMVRGALLALALVCASRLAAAGPNDLVLSRLATRIVENNEVIGTVGQSLELRALASQLGVVLAPRLLSPADTPGFGGFRFDVDVAQTSIDISESYWRARSGSLDPAGKGGGSHGPGTLRTVGVFARKGMWLPLPSFEIGAGAVHLLDSTTWTAQLYGKLALHEGYHGLPVPSVAVRGAVSRMMNQRELDLTVASLDVTLSKHLGIAGTWQLHPYGGWNLLMIVPRSEVIEGTVNIDPLVPGNEIDANNNFVFQDQDTILRHRILVGAKLRYHVVQLTLEAQYALAGTSVDDRPGTEIACEPDSMTSDCDAADTADAQTTLSLSLGLDF